MLLGVRATDHPHACGDKIATAANPKGITGSSPRVWGQVTKKMVDDLKARIIPTRVGTSLFKTRKIAIYWDHPHACGDKKRLFTMLTLIRGSSPRVWGQEDFGTKHQKTSRIIPTRVGTSVPQVKQPTLPKDHPHACGDKRVTTPRAL